MNFAVIATFVVDPESISFFEEKLQLLARTTKLEPGCLHYEVNKNSEVEGGYFIIEKYASYEDYLSHRESAHILEFRSEVAHLFKEPPTIYRGSDAF